MNKEYCYTIFPNLICQVVAKTHGSYKKKNSVQKITVVWNKLAVLVKIFSTSLDFFGIQNITQT